MMLTGVVGLGYYTKEKFMQERNMTSASEQEYKEFEIDFAFDLGEGEMKDLKVGPGDEDKVLVARYQGKLYSVGNYCTHFGAPLVTGQLFDDKVLCPWHTAGFSIVTGAPE